MQKLPIHNLGLYRLNNFVGRRPELALLKTWLNEYPVVAITGPSGVGKSALATALAVENAARFDEGVLWISATGEADFDFYDIVRDIEDVLATGITNQPVQLWPVLVLQQLYGFKRLLIIDELSDAAPDTIDKIYDMITQIGPGGDGRFILVGRDIPQRLLELVGEAWLVLEGMGVPDVAEWVQRYQHEYDIDPLSVDMLHQITGGHPLALQIVASLWHSAERSQLIDLASVQYPDDWAARLTAIVTAALVFLNRTHPDMGQLLTRCGQSSGGLSAEAITELYWNNIESSFTLDEAVKELQLRGLLMYQPEDDRYFIHPMIRRYSGVVGYVDFGSISRRQHILAHARYYLKVARQFNRLPFDQWPSIDVDWGNIRKVLNYLVEAVQQEIEFPLEQAYRFIDAEQFPQIPTSLDNTLIFIRDYALALSNYLAWRHPPEARRWLSAAMIACRVLRDRAASARLGVVLAALAYFHQNYQMAHTLYRRGLPYFKETGDYVQVVQIAKDLGTVLRVMDQLEEALAIYTEALSLAVTHKLTREQAIIQTLVASIYYQQQDYKTAIDWHHKALITAKDNRHLDWQAAQYNNIGLALEADGHYQQAIDYYQKAVNTHQQAHNKKGLSTTYGNLGAAYYQVGQPEQALIWYTRDMKSREELGNWLDLAAILHNMGHVALELDDLDAGVAYFTRSRDLYRQFGQSELAEEEQILIDTIKNRRVYLG